ncbi:SdpI family protein [Corynebacterium diphtheriae bv. gravis]|nr:SdpI family protein [Corynebacterium diphtheriae bv. gravis]UWF11113.1 SdpI family protein [Corynebacterium diphtheriae bv. gravis]
MPIAAALSASVGLILLSVLCLTLPKVAMSGNIQRNSAIGIRTKETKKSDSAWLEGHRKATPILQATGIITLGITAILLVSSFFQAFPPSSACSFWNSSLWCSLRWIYCGGSRCK